MEHVLRNLESDYEDKMMQREEYWDRLFQLAPTHEAKIEIRERQAEEAQHSLEAFDAEVAKITHHFDQVARSKDSKLEQLSYELDKSASKIAHDSSTIEKLQSGVGELAENVSELKQELRTKQLEIKKLDEQKHKLRQCDITAQELQACLAELHATRAQCQSQTEQSALELESVLHKLSASKQAVSELKHELNKEHSHHTHLLEQLEKWTGMNQELEHQLSEHKSQLAHERVRLESVHETSRLNAEQEQQLFKQELAASHQRSRELLENCASRLGETEAKLSSKQQRIEELEASLSEIHKNGAHLSVEQVAQLRDSLDVLAQENAQLKTLVDQFQKSVPHTETMVHMIKDTHHKLSKTLTQSESHMQVAEEQLEANNKQIKSYAAEIQLLRAHIKNLETKVKSCLFPGEKRVLVEQLEQTIDKRNKLASVTSKILAKNSQLVQENAHHQAEYHKIRNMLEKHRLDTESLSKLVQQSSGLNAKLVAAQTSIREKDAQLNLLAKQLDAVLAHSKANDKNVEVLRKKLQFATSPEQLESLNTKLIQCQLDRSQNESQAEHLGNVVLKLEEHNRLSNEKIRSLIEVLKLTEDSKMQVVHEQERRRELEAALDACAFQKADITKQLTDRLQLLDQQYQANLVQHARLMNEANAKIAHLSGNPKAMSSYPGTETAREKYFHDLQEKEIEMMRAREHVLDEVREAVSQPQTNLQARIADIYARGNAREQQLSKDMLELQAINEQLAHEYNAMRQAQWKLLQETNQQSKQDAVNMVKQSNPSLSSSLSRTRDILADSQNAHINSAKRDLEKQLEAQTRYSNHLKSNILPKMRATEAMIEELDMPGLREKLAQDSREAIEYLDRDDNEAEDQRRSISLLEDKLKAMQVERNQLSTSIAEWIKKPGPKARTDVIEAANADHAEIMRRMRASAQFNDNSRLRLNLVVSPRTPEQVAKEMDPAQMGISSEKSQISITQGGQTSKYHTSPGGVLSVMQPPEILVSSLQPRFERAALEKRDTIVVSYAYENSANAKYTVFLHAIEKLFGTIRKYMGSNSKVSISMVRISTGLGRLDLLGNKQLPTDCNFKTCKPVVRDIKADSVKEIMDEIKTNLPDAVQEAPDNHVVLSMMFPDKRSVHIVDVLYSVQSDTDIRLLDRNWIDYLEPVIADNNYFIDLLFNVIPSTDPVSLQKNNEMLQLSYRISRFLAQFQTLTSSTPVSKS